MPSSRAHPRVQPFGHALGGLHPEAMDEQLLGELALGLQRGHQLGDLLAGGHRLQRDDVGALGVQRAIEVGQADAVVTGLAGKDQAVQLTLAGASGSHTISSLPSELQGK